MKKLLFLFFTIFAVVLPTGGILADTVNIDWMVDGETYAQTTCATGADLILPTAPTKYGYTFQGWDTYTILEYIEFTGTQWIDTNYIMMNNSDAEIVINISNKIHNTSMFGAQNGNERAIVDFFDTIYCGDGYNRMPYSLQTDNNIHILKAKYNANNRTLSINIDGREIASSVQSGQFPGSTTYYIGTINGGQNLQILKAKLYGVALYQNNILVRDFIPARRNSDNAVGMYDLVSKKFFGNAGTGTFIAGPDL